MKILIAGIGNLFQGDDAFGCEVVKHLAGRQLPGEVQLFDYGIRSLDLIYALMDNPDLAILIDAASRGGAPGDLYLIEPAWDGEGAGAALDAHSMNPVEVLRAAQTLGARPKRVLLVGCEPADLGGEQGRMGLTEPVQAAAREAADMVLQLIQNQLQEAVV